MIADPGGSIIGMVSQRDIIRAIGQRGAAALDDRASFHMTSRFPKPTIADYVALTSDLFD
jgi:hypothetical protein